MAKAKKAASTSHKAKRATVYNWSGGYSTKNLGGKTKGHKLRKALKA